MVVGRSCGHTSYNCNRKGNCEHADAPYSLIYTKTSELGLVTLP